MDICPNIYYNQRKDNKVEYRVSETETCQQIKEKYHEYGGIIGHRSMSVFLARKGIILSKTTVYNYMNKVLHLHCVCHCKKPDYKKDYKHKVFSKLLKQNFEVEKPIKLGVQTLHIYFFQTDLLDITAPLSTYTIVVLSHAKTAAGLPVSWQLLRLKKR